MNRGLVYGLTNSLAGILLAGGMYFTSDLKGDEIRKLNERKKTFTIHQVKSPNYSPERNKAIEGIVIHSTEGSGESALNWLTNTKSKASAHYLIMEDGKTYQLVKDKDRAWHVGKYGNPTFIGIEIAGYASKPNFTFTDSQYHGAAILVSYLMKKHNINKEKVVSHDWVRRNLGGTNHTDPDPNFDWQKFYRLLSSYQRAVMQVEVIDRR